AAVPRRQQDALEQFGADAVALPGPFNTERGFSLSDSERTQFRGSPQNSVREKSIDDTVRIECRIGVMAHERVADSSSETVAAAGRVEPQQVIRIVGSVGLPQFADHAVDGQIVHARTSEFFVVRAPRPSPPPIRKNTRSGSDLLHRSK